MTSVLRRLGAVQVLQPLVVGWISLPAIFPPILYLATRTHFVASQCGLYIGIAVAPVHRPAFPPLSKPVSSNTSAAALAMDVRYRSADRAFLSFRHAIHPHRRRTSTSLGCDPGSGTTPRAIPRRFHTRILHSALSRHSLLRCQTTVVIGAPQHRPRGPDVMLILRRPQLSHFSVRIIAIGQASDIFYKSFSGLATVANTTVCCTHRYP